MSLYYWLVVRKREKNKDKLDFFPIERKIDFQYFPKGPVQCSRKWERKEQSLLGGRGAFCMQFSLLLKVVSVFCCLLWTQDVAIHYFFINEDDDQKYHYQNVLAFAKKTYYGFTPACLTAILIQTIGAWFQHTSLQITTQVLHDFLSLFHGKYCLSLSVYKLVLSSWYIHLL